MKTKGITEIEKVIYPTIQEFGYEKNNQGGNRVGPKGGQ